MTATLIICIGNIARGDDGAAHRVADLAEAAGLPAGTRLLRAVGLDVAMAADVADAEQLVIIDAQRRHAPAVEVERIRPGPAMRPTGHAIDAPSLLALSETLYGRTPPAWVLAVAAPEMGHGETLSETAMAACEEAAIELFSLLGCAK